ncbi:outer membrane scaffolding protein for murein synthesis (MipA/OmpV family) [Yoonia maricola]|uniref:Outer membrane scaffolding protein for murein synthesis (MipA/OmpV family) n=1 Tax=Yoonia maricola TaxID=420999 RepID=A0A2M8WJW8_9RHOB|nr:MipA/OmpV family protein [Yoonia maricola]PJI91231.1 outer membrane scaffolding protein for murein synthesis (MipA/OmpV family) [Yoonia maricola]
MLNRLILSTVLLTVPLAAAAQEQANGIEFRFGLGPSIGPGYFGDEDYDIGVRPKFQLERFQFGDISRDRRDRATGLRFSPSIRFIGARSADDFDELTGLDDIDPTLEIGGGLAFRTADYEVFAKLRYGAIGHEAFVAELGSDIFYQPSDQLTFKAGPRILFGDADYAQTYFGVTADESAASSFDAFDAAGGLMSAGAKAEATYAINDDWQVVGTLQYDQLLDDAADSPITQSDDLFSGSIVLTRRITLGF